jgi:hypothetical protein
MTPQVISLSAAGNTAWIPVDYKQNPSNIGITVVLSNTPNLTYNVQYTADDIFNTSITPTAFSTSLAGLTASASGSLERPVRAVRLNIASYTSGTATMTLLQGANNSSNSAAMPNTTTALGNLINNASNKVSVVGTDYLPLLDSQDSNDLKKATVTDVSAAISASIAAGAALVSGASAEADYKLNSSDVIGANCGTSLLLTTSYVDWKSTIGGQTKPVGIAGSNSDPAAPVNTARGVPWTDDLAYVAGSADVTTIVGGYDHVCNQIAGSIIGGGHHFIPYNSGGHSTIVGGSVGKNAGSYSIIAGGTNNTIGVAAQAGIFAGSNNVTSSLCSGILAGANTEIGSNNTYSSVIGGRYSIIGANGGYNAILSGQSNTIQDNHKYVVLLGRDAKSEITGTFTQGRTKLVNLGDCQSTIITFGIRTTSASATNMTASEGFFWALGSVACAVVVNCTLVGIDEATGATSAYSYTGVVKWDGSTTASVNDAGGSASTRPFTQIVDGIGVAGLPVLASSTGAIRPQVQGKEATNIKWCCTITAGAVRV